MTFGLSDVVGIIGVSLIVVSYFLLQTQRIESSRLLYSVLNAVGALLVIFSLYFNFNFSAFVVEFFWLLISFYGIVRALLSRNK